MAVLLFCQCGSDRVDLKLWNVRRAQLHCLTCGQEAWLEGFTVSEFDPAKLLTGAVIDQALEASETATLMKSGASKRFENHRNVSGLSVQLDLFARCTDG